MTDRALPITSIDAPEILEAIERYQSLTGTRRLAARENLLAQYPGVAEELSDCLDALDMIVAIGPDLGADLDASAHDLPPRSPGSAIPRALGDFRILRELGRGGMGVVYEAEQLSLGRRVALKVLPFASFLDERRLRRFHQEAQTAALLKHPNIVGVHCVGQDRGVFYYAMDLVPGQSLAEFIGQFNDPAPASIPSNLADDDDEAMDAASCCQSHGGQSSEQEDDTHLAAQISTQRDVNRTEYFRSMARIGKQVAEALQFAHEQGVIHRDIKPSNLLLDCRGAISIADFGLAQVQCDAGDDAGRLTMSGDLLGTLRYMSPEQAVGGRVVDHRTDIYSLGATLYELLTLSPAVNATNHGEAIQQIAERHPIRLRKHDNQVPVDLEKIVLHAMSKRPEDRYQSAADFAQDLQNFLDHKPALARRAGHYVQLRAWVRRNRLLASC
ncbi:MAG: serine/threonine protein kinase [Planctomycetales bacterium]|nr:serine/threonine protein kinase [Planctomycetales bacterium]